MLCDLITKKSEVEKSLEMDEKSKQGPFSSMEAGGDCVPKGFGTAVVESGGEARDGPLLKMKSGGDVIPVGFGLDSLSFVADTEETQPLGEHTNVTSVEALAATTITDENSPSFTEADDAAMDQS